ncbi:lysine-2,3-aminomutase-like protein [Phenylobacterium sp.]|uniref:lysine-2,3-aminomutase-like protein n=1 Tax=Phenylobacterium sp. TaxID=1871053 RepID=UPI002F429662
MNRPILRTPRALAEAGLVDRAQLPALEQVAARYAVAITPDMADLAATTPAVARQFTPDAAELVSAPEELADPVGDAAHSPVTGIVHRYPDRVLLKPTHTCAVYCRFCFRREMVGPQGLGTLSPAELDAATAYIAARPQIWEVIVTGGDPLVLSPRRLRALMARLSAIGHVKVVRFHTRMPVVDPAAITPALVAALNSPTQAVWVALHANHPAELTPQARAACARIVDAGLPMVSQTVLLRGVNDDAAVLDALMRAFVETRIKPYYLHHGDLAPGTAHLRTTVAEGQALMRALRGRASGLCQPAYVLDIPGGAGKAPVGPVYYADGAVQDPWGGTHAYPPRPCGD